jgi:hypothetical protein
MLAEIKVGVLAIIFMTKSVLQFKDTSFKQGNYILPPSNPNQREA